MRLSLCELRQVIREVSKDCWGGSQPDETYDQEIGLDEAEHEESVLVPDDIKHQIRHYFKAMGLSGTKKKS